MSYFPIFCRSLLVAWLPAALTFAQTGSVGIGTASPNPAAALDITATGKGLLIPRLDSATRIAVANPPAGLMVYQTSPRAGFYYYTGAAWVFIPDKARAGDNLGNHTATQNLSLQGNALVGTGADVGRTIGIGVTTTGGLNMGQGNGSIFIGYQAGLNGALPGTLYLGYQAGQQTNGGDSNQFIGNFAGQSYGGGYYGSYNTLTGYQSGRTTGGSHNTYTGYQSGGASTGGGSFNTYTGSQSGAAVSGSNNTFSGYQSGYQSLNSSGNVFIGVQSGYGNHTGNYNVLIGYQSGYGNAGHSNVFLGSSSGYSNTTGSNNVLLGDSAGYQNTKASNNQFAGLKSGYSNTTGSNNAFSGYQSGYYNTTGSSNTALGAGSGPASGSGAITNAAAIGANVSLTQSNTVVLGNGASVGIGTSAPAARLQVQPAGDPDRGVQVGDNSSAANLVLQPLTGANAGYSFLGINGYYNAGEQRINTTKNRWRVGADQRASSDLFFLDTYDGTTVATVLAAVPTGNVGVGTITPRQRLEVAGTIFSSLGGFAFPDGTTQTTAAGAATFIQNQTTQQASSNFNISGTGTIGGSALVSGRVGIGTTAPTSSLQVAGSVATSIRTLGTSSGTSVTIADTDYTVLMTGNLNLPDASAANKGRLYYVLLSDYNIGGSGYYLLQGNLHYPGSSPYGNSSAVGMGNNTANYKSITVQSDGTQWWVLAYSK